MNKNREDEDDCVEVFTLTETFQEDKQLWIWKF